MRNLYQTFEKQNPDAGPHHLEMQRILSIESRIQNIVDEMTICCMKLNSSPIKDSLSGFCKAWKMCYVQKLHSSGKVFSLVYNINSSMDQT